mgnify:CR=1 FL=1
MTMRGVAYTILGFLVILGPAKAAEIEPLYKGSCALCHDAGIAGAPKLGDTGEWRARIAQGRETLYKSALEGKSGTAMIAKGGSAKISDDDIKKIVDFMIEQVK